MELQTTNGQTLTQIQYSPNQVALGKQVRRLSLAGNPSFPIPDAFIIDYIQTIEEQAPDITPSILQKMVNMMLTGKLPYDVNKGIRNIFEGFETYKEIRRHYYLANVETGKEDFATEDTDFNLIDKTVWKLRKLKRDKQWFGIESYQGNDFETIDEDTWYRRQRNIRNCQEGHATQEPFADWLECMTKVWEKHKEDEEKRQQERKEAEADKNSIIEHFTPDY